MFSLVVYIEKRLNIVNHNNQQGMKIKVNKMLLLETSNFDGLEGSYNNGPWSKTDAVIHHKMIGLSTISCLVSI